MAREDFDRDLGRLEADLVLLGGLVENAIFSALASLETRDLERSQSVIEEDDLIDEKRLEIENACVEMFRRQSPLAGDLRRIVAILRITNELERMGDYAEGIAKISLLMGNETLLEDLAQIPRMAEIAVGMLKRSLEAFLERDPKAAEEKAIRLARDDDIVDDLYAASQADLFEMMRQSPDNLETATYMMWVGHNLERIADRATNIGENAVFQATGEVVQMSRKSFDHRSAG